MACRFSRLAVSVPLLTLFLLIGLLSAQKAPAYSQAESLVRQGQLDEGIQVLLQVLQAEPNNLKARNLMGIALTQKNQLKDADAEYERVLKIDPRFYPALKNLAINEVALKDFASAERHLKAALPFAPNDPVIHAYLGRIAFARKQYKDAAGHLEKAGSLLKDPSFAAELVAGDLAIGQQARALEVLKGLDPTKLSPRLQFGLGLALAARELYREAVPYFQAVSAAYPQSNDAAFNLALCYVESKQYAPAIELLRGVVARGQDSAEVENLLAEAYEGNKQTQPAIDALRTATRLAPQDESNYVDLATLCTTYEAYDIAMDVIEVGLHYLPNSDRLIFQRGVVRAMQSQFEQAEQDFQLAARLAPQKNLSYVALGVSYMQQGDLAKAIDSLRARIRQKPNDATLHYLLGEALIRAGAAPGDAKFDEAKRTLMKAVRLNPKLSAARVDLGKLYVKENLLDEAAEQLEQARTLDPSDKAVYSQLAIVYRRKGKPEQASAMLVTLNQLNNEERKQGHRVRLHTAAEESAKSE